MPWTFPILTALRSFLYKDIRKEAPTEAIFPIIDGIIEVPEIPDIPEVPEIPDEDLEPQKPELAGIAKNITYLESIAGEKSENWGTYEGKSGKLYTVHYWPTWKSCTIHHAQGTSAGYIALSKWYPTLEAAQADIQRVL